VHLCCVGAIGGNAAILQRCLGRHAGVRFRGPVWEREGMCFNLPC
jgi:hypothetical protein